MKKISETENALTEDLMALPDVFERMSYLAATARLGRANESDRMEVFQVHGCMAELHIIPALEAEHWTFSAFTEAPMVAAIAELFCRLHSGHTTSEILAHNPSILERTGIFRQLSPHRQAGAANIIAKIKGYVSEHADAGG